MPAKYGKLACQLFGIKGVKRWANWQRHWLEMMPLLCWRVGQLAKTLARDDAIALLEGGPRQRHWLEMMPLLCWRVGQGAISAWYDTWLGKSLLVTYSQFIPTWPHDSIIS